MAMAGNVKDRNTTKPAGGGGGPKAKAGGFAVEKGTARGTAAGKKGAGKKSAGKMEVEGRKGKKYATDDEPLMPGMVAGP